mgnify:CR=1 FL=1
MVELKLCVSDVDYDAAIRALSGGGVAGAAAAMAARALSDSAKEEFAVKYINSNARKLESMLETAASKQGIHLRISDAQAVIK